MSKEKKEHEMRNDTMTTTIWKSLRGAFTLLFVVVCFAASNIVRAEGPVVVLPAVIDQKAAARNILSEHITLRNTTDQKKTLYPVVQNVLIEDGRQEFIDPSRADLSSSLAHWVSLSRGAIDLQPGEERTIEFEVRVNYAASPRMYHALLSFPAGSNRPAAEARLDGAPAVMLNLEVLDESKEVVRLRSFASKNRFFTSSPVEFFFELENTGDVPVLPEGDILIYDRTGREVENIQANMSAIGVPPSVRQTFSAALQNSLGIGRYKALLSLRYGEKTTGQITDTVFFWVLPIPTVITLLTLLFGGTGIFLVYLHRRYERVHRRLAPALPPQSAPSSPAFPNTWRPAPVVDLRGAARDYRDDTHDDA